MVDVPASQVADLQQTLPFVAARAHAITAAASAHARPARSIAARSRRRRWAAGAALMVTLTVSVAAGGWMRSRQGDASAADPLAVAVGATPSLPSRASTLVDVAAPSLAPTGAGRVNGIASDVAAAHAASAPSPMAVATHPAPTRSAQGIARAPGSPRQTCGGRERYALLQCMETQCAKKAWIQHEQCVRLRKERKL
jgi:hypothetical protein